MATGDDFLTRFRPGAARPEAARPDAKSSVISMLEEAASEAKPAEPPPEARKRPQEPPGDPDAAEALPGDGDTYTAHSRASNKPQIMLGFVTREVPLDAFAYSDLRRVRLLPPDEPGGGPVLVLRFVEAGITDVEIRGRNLHLIADYVRQHRLAWLREIPARQEVRDPTAAVIDSIVIRPASE